MKRFAVLLGAAMMLAGAANRAEAQFFYGPGFVYPWVGSSFTSIRGPFGGGITVANGPFGGGAVSIRGPLGGGLRVVRPGIVPFAPVVAAPVMAAPVAAAPVVVQPAHVVRQTVVNPAVKHRFLYSPAYRARIPANYRVLEIAAVSYYYTPALPPASQAVTVGGTALYAHNGLFYQPHFLKGRTVYLVVER